MPDIRRRRRFLLIAQAQRRSCVQADIDRFLRLAEQAERAITTGIFYPNDNYMCGVCGYKEMCTQW